MFIELRVPLQVFLTNLRSRLKQLAIARTDPLPLADSGVDLPGCAGVPIWLDRIQVWDGTIISATSDSTLEILQPIDIFIVSEPALVSHNAAPTPPCWQRTVVAVFELSTFVDGDGPKMCLSFTEFRPGTDVAPPIIDFLNTTVTTDVPQLQLVCQTLNIGLLETMFGGQPPAVTNVALAINGNDRIALRLDFDLQGVGLSSGELAVAQAVQTAQRDNFVSGYFLADDSSKDWTMQVHALLLRQAARAQLLSALEGQQATFALEAGPSTEFLLGSDGVGRVEIDFSGEVIDACQCAWDMIDLDVDVHTTLYFTLPQPDTLHGELDIEFDLSDIEVFCCAVTSSLLWFMVGQAWLDHDQMSAEAFAGATVAQLTLGPIFITLGFMALAHGLAASQFDPGGTWIKTSPGDDDPLVYERDWKAKLGDLGFGKMTITGMHGVNSNETQGLAMSGTLVPPRERSDPHLVIDADSEFVVSFADPCAVDPMLQAEWHLWLNSSPGGVHHITTPIEVFDVRIVDGSDPLNQFAPFLQHDGSTAWIYVPLTALKTSYAAAPYAPKLLVITSGGVRILTLPMLPAWTPQQVNDALAANALWRVVGCHDWGNPTDPFWHGGRVNPKWLVDPGPDSINWQVWSIGVKGMVPGDALRVETSAGQVLQTVRVGDGTGAAWSGVFAPGTELSMFSMKEADQPSSSPQLRAMSGSFLPPLRLTTANLASTLRELTAATRGEVIAPPVFDARHTIDMRQRALRPLAQLDAAWGVRSLLATRVNDAPALIVADHNGASVWAIDRPEAPRHIARRTLQNLQRAFVWQGSVWLVGGGRLTSLRGDEGATAPCCGEAILDADACGTHRFALTSRALWHRDSLGAPERWLRDTRADRLAVHRQSLALADETGVLIVPRHGARRAAPLERMALRGVRSLEACEGPGDSYRAVDEKGHVWRLSMTGGRVGFNADSDDPPQLVARSGTLLAIAREDARTVMLGRLGHTRLLRR